jgi:hypothetical protein
MIAIVLCGCCNKKGVNVEKSKAIKEPIVVFVKNAAGGRKLADEKDWYFCDGSASIAGMTAEAFRTGHKDGIVIIYSCVAMGLNVCRSDNTIVLIGAPSIAQSAQAEYAAGVRKNLFGFNTRPVYSFKTIDELRLRLGKHKCHCLVQVINLCGCQCGGI